MAHASPGSPAPVWASALWSWWGGKGHSRGEGEDAHPSPTWTGLRCLLALPALNCSPPPSSPLKSLGLGVFRPLFPWKEASDPIPRHIC